jgi:hypothetical protein
MFLTLPEWYIAQPLSTEDVYAHLYTYCCKLFRLEIQSAKTKTEANFWLAARVDALRPFRNPIRYSRVKTYKHFHQRRVRE